VHWSRLPGQPLPVPPSVVALVDSGRLPATVAECVGETGPDWPDVARAHSPYFPSPVVGFGRLITGLVGHGVPDVVAELADLRRAQAAGGKFRLDRADRAALARADRETGGHS
jgi:hypothetical protein